MNDFFIFMIMGLSSLDCGIILALILTRGEL